MKLSVIIPAYNAAATLGEAMGSVEQPHGQPVAGVVGYDGAPAAVGGGRGTGRGQEGGDVVQKELRKTPEGDDGVRVVVRRVGVCGHGAGGCAASGVRARAEA